MAVNPWQVDSVQAFSFLKCPECTFEIQEEHFFQVHAVENHPLSFVLFGKKIKEEGFNEHYEMWEENYQDCNENHDLEDPISTDYLQIKQEEVEIKESNNLKEENIEVKKKSHQCLVCDASFDRSGLLKRHVESVHEGKRPFECVLCFKGFAESSGLKMHIRTVHEKEKPWQCDLCSSTFSQKGHLKSHVESVHEGKKPYLCTICGSNFCDKSALKKHIARTHEGKNPKICKICDATFEKKIDLVIHIGEVHDGKGYKCSFCDNTYTTPHGISYYIFTKLDIYISLKLLLVQQTKRVVDRGPHFR